MIKRLAPDQKRKPGTSSKFPLKHLELLREALAKKEKLPCKEVSVFLSKFLANWWHKYPYHLDNKRPESWPAEPDAPVLELDGPEAVVAYNATMDQIAKLKRELVSNGDRVSSATILYGVN